MGAMRLSSRLGRQAIFAVRVLLAGALLVVTLVPPADAQRGLGKGRQHPPEQAPAAEPAPGEYALEGPQAIEAVNRGEGRQALAYYERTAGPVEALRQAQIETMATFPHPYSWAAFGLSGVPR